MMNSDYELSISGALREEDPTYAIDTVKHAVIKGFLRTDHRIKVEKTDYFNHTFVPDMVLSWPEEKKKRFVFLRTDSTAESFTEDLKFADEKDSIFFSLASHPGIESDSAEVRTLRGQSANSGALVTNPSGIANFLRNRSNSPVVSLASSAFLQGGKGVVGGDEANEISDDIVTGFFGANNLNRVAIKNVVSSINSSFDLKTADRLKSFLQAVWIGSGGHASAFPASVYGTGSLDDSSLEFLLNLEDIDDDEFWKRIGRGITLERISRLKVNQPSNNLQRIISNNLDTITAKICRVIHDQPQVDDPEEAFYWALDRGMLALKGKRFSAFIAARAEDLKISPESSHAMTIPVLLERTAKNDIKVGELEITTDRRNISYGSDSTDDITQGSELTELVELLGPSASVRAVEAIILGSRSLRCDFTKMTASGRTASRFPVSSLVSTSLGLLADLNEDERSALRASTPRQDNDPETLF